MKTIYTILFFADTLLLVVLAYSFLKLMDKGISVFVFVMMLIAIICCLMLLVYFLSRYIQLPPAGDKK